MATHSRHGPASRSIDRLIPLGCVLLAVALSGYALSKPHFLTGIHSFNGTGYDDGVYYGAVDRFLHGAVPYKDFTFVQPPGVLLLLAPVGLLGRAFGTSTGLAIARVVTLIVAVVNVGLVCSILRAKGRIATAIGGVTLAVFPLGVTAYHSVNLEPYLVLLCLVAVRISFTGNDFASSRRILIAGAVLGFATDVKVWGATVAIALVLTCLSDRRRLVAAVAGVAGGFVVPALPFFIGAPRGFVHQVLVAQAERHDLVDALPLTQRFGLVLGLDDQSTPTAHSTLAVTIGVVIAVLVVVCFAVWWRRLSALEWFLLLATAGLLGLLLSARQFYDHYTYATAALLAMLVAVVISRYLDAAARPRRGEPTARTAPGHRVAVAAVCLLVAVVGALGLSQSLSRTSAYLKAAVGTDPALATIVPAGSCAVTDDPVLLIAARRWDSPRPGCGSIVDPFGMFVNFDKTPPPGTQPFPTSLVRPWLDALTNADYVVLSVQNSTYLPFSPDVLTWFGQHFSLVYNAGSTNIYVHRQ